jgi:hypothetical protein
MENKEEGGIKVLVDECHPFTDTGFMIVWGCHLSTALPFLSL